jgi:hypothetical protein
MRTSGFLFDRLSSYNIERTGHADRYWLAVFLRDEKKHIVAGLRGWTWGR